MPAVDKNLCNIDWKKEQEKKKAILHACYGYSHGNVFIYNYSHMWNNIISLRLEKKILKKHKNNLFYIKTHKVLFKL